MIDKLADIFREHIECHLKIPIRTREQQLGHERQTISDYRGRVLVELFQNAIDRATGLVRIESSPGRLVVANDGDPLSGPISIYPLANVGADGRLDRSNFHSLCSISTSRKLACEAIGNKGIGFKSVFRTARSVEVWSRTHADQTWWGFRLVHEMTRDDALAAAERTIERAGGDPATSWRQLWLSVADSLKDGPAPSFYFPELLPASSAPAECREDVLTAVVLDLKPENDIPKQTELFLAMPLHFVAARYPGKQEVRVLVGDQERSIAFMASWDHFPLVPHTRVDLVKAAAAEGLVFDEQRPPAIQLAFLPEDSKRAQGLFHCFFPTKAASGFCTDIHADFVLDQSRKGLDIEAGGYNAELLQSFPDLLVSAFEQRLHQRIDAWDFLTPGEGADPYLVKLVAKRLFGPNHAAPSQWVALVRLAFDYWNDPVRGGAPWGFHEGFWQCVQSWWPVGLWGKPSNLQSALIGPLKAAVPPIAIVPVIGSGHPNELLASTTCPALPLPEAKLDDGRVILLRTDSEADRHTFRDVPRALADVIAITRQFPRDKADFWADVRKFEWTDVVIASRRWLQGRSVSGATADSSTNKPGLRRRWGPDDLDYVDVLRLRMANLPAPDRNELLRFWYDMVLDSAAEATLPAERLFAQAADRLTGQRVDDVKDNRAPRLRAEAALPLPVLGGGFLPACRVSASTDSAVHAAAQATSGWGVLDRKALETLGLSEGAVAKLAQRLGLFKVVPLISAHRELGLHLPFDPETLEPALWHPLLRAWMLGFEQEGTLPDELSFAASLLNAEWFPIDNRRCAPAVVWSVPDNAAYTLLPVVRERTGASSLLGRLGIVSLPPADGGEAKVCDAKAATAICCLKENGGLGAVSREARRLFSRLIRCLGDAGSPVPVLLGKGPDAHWAEPTDVGQAWLATDNARALRNYFPHLQFVDAFGSADLASRLGVQFFNPTEETDHDGTPPAADDAMREHLAAAMPYLLAVVDSQRLTRLEFWEVMGRWESAAVLRTDNVYLRLKLSGGRTEEIGLKDSAGRPILNEMFMPDNLTAWHDVPDLEANSEVWLPRFASWFADAVFNAKQLAHRLRPLLHALGEDAGSGATVRTDNHLKLFDIDSEEVDHWRKQFNEARMSSAQRDEAVLERQEILQQFGTLKPEADLLAPTLTPAVFATIRRPEAQAKEVETALQAARSLPARFAAEATNRVRWNQAKAGLRDDILVGHLLHKYNLPSVAEADVEQLLNAWETCSPAPAALNRLGFDPKAYAQSLFPGREPLNADERHRATEVLHRRPYAIMETTLVTLRSLNAGGPGAAPSQAQADRATSDAKKHERGTRAEEARANEAATRVLAAKESEHLRAAIDAERSRVAARLSGKAKGLAPLDWAKVDDGGKGALVDALWIAKHADCGYDVLDVDVSTNAVLQVEVKSSGVSAGKAGLYLSRTELKVARTAQQTQGVQYRLEVYLGLSRRVDATAALEQALQNETWLTTVLDSPVSLAPNEFYMEINVPE